VGTSPTDPVLYGDSGLLIQAYGAVALLSGPLAIAPVYARPALPAISPVEPLSKYPRAAPVDYTA
jgi:hypothetical protein